MKKYFTAHLELFHILNNFNMVVLSSYIYQILSQVCLFVCLFCLREQSHLRNYVNYVFSALTDKKINRNLQKPFPLCSFSTWIVLCLPFSPFITRSYVLSFTRLTASVSKAFIQCSRKSFAETQINHVCCFSLFTPSVLAEFKQTKKMHV